MKKITALTAAVLSVCLFALVFSSCDKTNDKSKKNTDNNTTANQAADSSALPTNEDGIAYSMGADGHRYYIYPDNETETESSNIAQPTKQTLIEKTTEAETNKATVSKAEKTTKKNDTTAKSNISNETVKNESKGISVISKTSPVKKGNSASVTIMGQSGKTYSIEFYKNSSAIASADGLGTQTADSNGLVTWTFEVGYDCEVGNRKIIIKEKGSDNFVQTSITVE